MAWLVQAAPACEVLAAQLAFGVEDPRRAAEDERLEFANGLLVGLVGSYTKRVTPSLGSHDDHSAPRLSPSSLSGQLDALRLFHRESFIADSGPAVSVSGASLLGCMAARKAN